MNGLKLIPEFISKKLEKEIIKNIPDVWHTIYSHRSVQEYGTPIYKGERENPIPINGHYLITEMMLREAFEDRPEHISVNRYRPGGFITAHIDKENGGEIITILSLGSDVIMVFKKGDHTEMIGVPARSLLQLSGEARWEWTHETLPTEELRYSIVFRK